jgi:hypothetical protein
MDAHLPGSRKMVANMEEILWDPITCAFSGCFSRWAEAQRSKNMRSRLHALMKHYVRLHDNSPYPLSTEILARRLQDFTNVAVLDIAARSCREKWFFLP